MAYSGGGGSFFIFFVQGKIVLLSTRGKVERNFFMKKLLRLLLRYRRNVLLNIGCNILTAIFTVVSISALIPFLQILFDRTSKTNEIPNFSWSSDGLSGFSKYYFSQLINNYGKQTALVYVCAAIVLIFFLKNLFRYLALYFMAPVRNGVVRDLRQQLFDKIMALPLAYFSEERKGDLLSRITADVQEVEWSILSVLEVTFREPLVMVGSLIFMLAVSPSLTLFVFVLILFIAVIIGSIGKTLKRNAGAAQEQLGGLVSRIEETLSGLRIIKGFNAQSQLSARFLEENNAYRWLLVKILRRRDLSSPLSEFLGIAVFALLLWYGSLQVLSGDVAAETFFAFLFAFYNVIDPAKSFSNAYYNVQKGRAALDRVEQILDADNLIYDLPEAKEHTYFSKSIEFRKVSFFYKKEEKIIVSDIQINIPRGHTVALVGSSGAGKSTLADLLPRFYEVELGEILIDDINIKELTINSLRSLMGIVSQEAVLFNDTIFNNIAFGMPAATLAEVEQAARIANAHDFIVATELGYQTNIGDRGSKLSGGQRQRLTIARAVLKNPPILILDEATSALDSESERLVQDAIFKLMRGRTCLVIAHRLSTIQHADEIIVLRNGQIVERGTHDFLLSLRGEYAKLAALQAVAAS